MSIIRSALARRQRRLTRREYRVAARSDLTELPTRQQSAARRLLRHTFLTLRSIDLVVVSGGLLLLVTVLQFTSAHIRIESYPPGPLVVYRGLRRLDFLPGVLGPKPLFDTGLIVEDVPSHKRSAIESVMLRPWTTQIVRVHISSSIILSQSRQPIGCFTWEIGKKESGSPPLFWRRGSGGLGRVSIAV